MLAHRLRALILTALLALPAAPAIASSLTPEDIDRVVAAKPMTRDARGDFPAGRWLTRAEIARIVVQIFALDTRDVDRSPVRPPRDVPPSHWAYKDIQTVLRTGTMSGYRDGLFFPNQKVTRAEGFAIFAQAFGVYQFSDATVNEVLSRYRDAKELPAWSRQAIVTALTGGNVSTDEDGKVAIIGKGFVNVEAGAIRPNAPMTLGDLAFAASRYLQLVEASQQKVLPP